MQHVSVQTWVNCICGSLETIYLSSLAASGTCKRCGRTHVVKSIAYDRASSDGPHVVIGSTHPAP